MTLPYADVPMTPDQQQAQQLAQQELSQGKYHALPASPPPTATVVTPTPTPTPPAPKPHHHSSSSLTTILVIALIVVFGIVVLLVLRKIGKPRKDAKKDEDKDKAKDGGGASQGTKQIARQIPLTGAALHRYNAEQAAEAGDWQEAIRERFRAVIAMLDERALLPERRDRTADEAARDAGLLLPEHAEALADSALAFDEVEYGEYLGTPAGYGVICAVDEAVRDGRTTAVQR